ncbi:MAG TPA: hypothetical protein VIK74_03470 [Parasegetibacter sp.]|jgi:hypothetical protein
MSSVYKYFIFALVIISVGCKKEGPLNVSGLKYGQLYTYDNTPLGNRLQALFEETGSYVLYDSLYAKDFSWNFDKSLGPNWRANGVSNPNTNVPIVLDFFDQYWFGHYTKNFLRNFLPLRIVIADSILNGTQRQQFLKGEGVQLMSIRLVNTATTPMTTHIAQWTVEQKKNIAKTLHQNFFLETVANKLVNELPDEFFAGSPYDYVVDNASPSKKNPKELGFWNLGVDGANAVSPAKAVDVLDWLKNIAATLPQDMNNQFNYTVGGTTYFSQVMADKYQILQQYLQQKYGVNIHALNSIYL